jgi:biopolymer transport protein ExbD
LYQEVREPQPMGEINTTPLVDVMLVLLIMFIITIPLQSHAVKLDLPTAPPPDFVLDRIKNRVVITQAGGLLWNGRPASDEKFRSLLLATQRLAEEPELQLQPHALARYDRVDQVLATTKRSQVKRLGFVGNDAYGSF